MNEASNAQGYNTEGNVDPQVFGGAYLQECSYWRQEDREDYFEDFVIHRLSVVVGLGVEWAYVLLACFLWLPILNRNLEIE